MRQPRRTAITLTGGILAMMAFVAVTGGSAATPGCGPAAAPFEVDRTFTPWEGRFGYSDDPPLRHVANLVQLESAGTLMPFELRNPRLSMPLRAQLRQNVDDFDGDGVTEPALVSVYSPTEWTDDLTEVTLIERGGALFSQRTAGGFDAHTVASQLGTRATLVEVGPHEAALTHADPISAKGTRPYYLTWSDGIVDAQLIADMAPQQLIDIARTIYC